MRQLSVSVVVVVAGTLLALIAVPGPTARRSIVGGATHRRSHAADATRRAAVLPIPELARLDRTLHAWREELLAAFTHPGVSNGPTENLNLKIKNTKRVAHGYRNLTNYRPRLLLNHGRSPENHTPTRIRTRGPSLAA